MSIARVPALALVAGLGLFVAGGGADATTAPAVTCGTTLTESTTLSADLVSCPGTALVIGADGITVDLGGHTISGTNADGSEGIASDGHANVRIVGGGRITDFRINAIGIRGGSGNRVRGVTVRRIGAGGVEGQPVSAGIAISGSPRSRVIGNDVSNDVDAFQADGVDVIDSPGSVVARNRLVRNSWNGLVLIGSKRSRVTRNRLDGNKNNGAEVNGASDSAVVAANRAHGNRQFGIVVGSAHRVRVVRNRAAKNGTGFLFFDLHGSLISSNRAGANHDGLVLSGGQFGSDGNRLVGNVTNKNLGVGIAIVEDNKGHATGNSLKGNTANRNADHGMDVVAGTIDKGGNRASGNAKPPQCVNVACST
jgi:parallel beta-helix repeat protein